MILLPKSETAQSVPLVTGRTTELWVPRACVSVAMVIWLQVHAVPRQKTTASFVSTFFKSDVK